MACHVKLFFLSTFVSTKFKQSYFFFYLNTYSTNTYYRIRLKFNNFVFNFCLTLNKEFQLNSPCTNSKVKNFSVTFSLQLFLVGKSLVHSCYLIFTIIKTLLVSLFISLKFRLKKLFGSLQEKIPLHTVFSFFFKGKRI